MSVSEHSEEKLSGSDVYKKGVKMYPTINIEKTGKNIRRLMDEKGITTKQLAEYASISLPAIYHWYQGKGIPSVDNLYALSKLLQVPMDEIIVGNE